MKENNKSQMRRHEVDSPVMIKDTQTSSYDLLRERKEELRLLIERYKQKNQLLDTRIKTLKEYHCYLLVELTDKEYHLKKLTQQRYDMKRLEADPSYINELRELFKTLRRYMSLSLLEYEDDIDPDQMTYEQLLELYERIGKVSKGLSTQQIAAIPKLIFKKKEQTYLKCIVCCEDFTEDDSIMQLKCKHIFHSACILEWLKEEKICPLCKTETL